MPTQTTPGSTRHHIVRMWRIATLMSCILCLGPATLFTIRQFHENREVMEHHVETLERVLNSSGLAQAPDLGHESLVALLRDAIGASFNFSLYSGNTLVAEHITDQRTPVVSSRVSFTPGDRAYELLISRSLADRVPLMAGVLASSLVLLGVLLFFLRRNIYLRWSELQLQEEKKQAKLEIISDLGSDWIWSTDAAHRIIEMTQKPGAESYFSAMPGTCLWEQPSLIPDRPWKAIMEIMNDHQPLSCKIRFVIDEKQLLLEFMALPQVNGSGAFEGYVGITKDISYVLDRERIFEAEKSQLTRMVDQRSVDLLQAKLAAEEANLTKSRFLSTMSHEIRTPLNAIIGLTNLLQKTQLNFKQREYVDTVVSSSELLLRIINDILDLSKIETGKYELMENEFRLTDLLNDVTDLVRQRALAKRLEIVYDIDAHLLDYNIVSDQKRLSQALLNYLSNAIKFTDTGHILIKVTVHEGSVGAASGHFLLKFSVKDTGIGITPADQAKLFSLFSQVDNTYTRKFEGTGLGLYIVKNIAHLMQGEAGMSSRPGFGSTFWFTALVKYGEPCADHGGWSDWALLKGWKILVVDDNEDTCTVLDEGLTRAGMHVTSASSGDSAIRHVLEQDAAGSPFAAVIMDWHLPGKSGVHFAREIRSLPLARRPSLICLTARDLSEMLAEDQLAFDCTLTKPVDVNSLKTALARLHAGQKGMPATAPEPAEPRGHLRPSLVGKRALIVDDDKVSLKMAEYILSTHGVACVTCTDGKEALRILTRENHFDFVLIDIEMPVLDGISAIKIIRRMPRLSRLGVFVITAHAIENELDVIRRATVDDVLTKPYVPSQLLDMLEAHTRVQHDGEWSVAPDGDRTKSVLHDIQRKLKSGDPLVSELSAQYGDVLQHCLQDQFAAFERALSSYDFETAMSLVATCLVRLDSRDSGQPSQPPIQSTEETSP